MHSSFVYSRLGERTGLGDHLAVLSQVVAKVATNLRAYGRSEQLVHLTLQLFQARCVCVCTCVCVCVCVCVCACFVGFKGADPVTDHVLPHKYPPPHTHTNTRARARRTSPAAT